MEFTAVDIFQHSPFGDILNSLRSLSLLGEPWPDYGQQDWDADDKEIRHPPTTHLIATVDDSTDMLDFDSEDIDGMDDDAGGEEEPPPTRRWTSTSSYDVYMVDTPKENDDKERKDATKGCSLEKQSKWQHKCRPKSCLSRNSDHTDPALEQGESLPDHGNTENQTEQTNSIKDNSPVDITQDRHPEQQNARQRLVATARSLKSRSKGSRLCMTHSKSDAVKYPAQQRSTATIAPPRATQSRSCYLNSMRRPQTPHNQKSKQPPGRIDDLTANIERQTMPLTRQYAIHARARTKWTAQPDPSMDHASAPQHTM